MPTIDSASRRVPKATYVPLKVDARDPDHGSAILKFGYIRNLNLQVGGVDKILRAAHLALDPTLHALLKAFEGTPLSSRLPAPAAFANVAVAQIKLFGIEVTRERQQSVDRMPLPASAPEATAAVAAANVERSAALGVANHLLNAARCDQRLRGEHHRDPHRDAQS